VGRLGRRRAGRGAVPENRGVAVRSGGRPDRKCGKGTRKTPTPDEKAGPRSGRGALAPVEGKRQDNEGPGPTVPRPPRSLPCPTPHPKEVSSWPVSRPPPCRSPSPCPPQRRGGRLPHAERANVGRTLRFLPPGGALAA